MRELTPIAVIVFSVICSAGALGVAGCASGNDTISPAGAGAQAAGSQASGSMSSGAGGSSSLAGGGGAHGGSSASGSAGATNSSGAGASSASGFTSGVGGAPTMTIACQNHIYQCGDLIDNDGDGLIDEQDPDCLGPCDNTEGSYYGGIPGQAGPACTVDCYFDQDSGSGNDDCHWNHKCDPNEVSPTYFPESENGTMCGYDLNAKTPGSGASCSELYETQSAQCMSYCGPLTPNGCDCFGCCNLPAGSSQYVWLGSTDASGNGSCTLADVGDPTKCQPCEPVKACLNTCETCELCIGKSTLPKECSPGSSSSAATTTGVGGAGIATSAGAGGATGAGGLGAGGTGAGTSSASGGGGIAGQCPTGIQPCGVAGEAQCPIGDYCITGCCQILPR